MKIELEVSDKHEHTASPWWIIIDPSQNFKTNADGIHAVAGMITGPYFSREEAEASLRVRSHHYSKNAKVYCHSGCYSNQYDKAYRQAEKTINLTATNR